MSTRSLSWYPVSWSRTFMSLGIPIAISGAPRPNRSQGSDDPPTSRIRRRGCAMRGDLNVETMAPQKRPPGSPATGETLPAVTAPSPLAPASRADEALIAVLLQNGLLTAEQVQA